MDLLVSVDVEADGPIPGPYSMVSIGCALSATWTGRELVRLDLDAETFRAVLKPISDRWDPEALAISGMTREYVLGHGEDPAEVMDRCAAWVVDKGKQYGAVPVFAGYPVGYDWLFSYWYFMSFSKSGSPFGHGRHFDIKTAYAVKAGVPICEAVKAKMPRSLRSARPHTHDPLDDAKEQGDLGCNIIEWDGRL